LKKKTKSISNTKKDGNTRDKENEVFIEEVLIFSLIAWSEKSGWMVHEK